MDEINILSEVVKAAQGNEIILFLIALGLIMLAIMVQIYRMISGNKKFEHERDAATRKDVYEDKKLTYDMVRDNTSANIELRTTNAKDNAVITELLQRLNNQININTESLNNMKHQIERIEWPFIDRRLRLEDRRSAQQDSGQWPFIERRLGQVDRRSAQPDIRQQVNSEENS